MRMVADMDINAGVVLDGTPVEVVGKTIFNAILATASGEKTKSELLGVGEEEFAPLAYRSDVMIKLAPALAGQRL